ncbi:zinc finger protein 420-like [Diabrotica virgifera virgifera]|uniref:C2H2-type domain-containing protein n=1 Tax=Diabrotica virgifera virgifera TaxID=50390 RepID=A0ABM5L0Q8_DIAVI|nr:zinc finger protein 420-like [Diabrotica virgifera virgifera]
MDPDQFKQFMMVNQETLNQLHKSLASTSNSNNTNNFIPLFENFDEQKENFKIYIERYENYLKIKHVFDDKKFALDLLLNSIGSATFSMLSSLVAPHKIRDFDYNTIVKKLDNRLNPKKNILVLQHKFLSLYQQENQSISEYTTALKQATLECEFISTCECQANISEHFLRAQFIRGINDNLIRERLLESNEKSFEKLEEKALILESSIIDSKEFSSSNNSLNINQINKSRQRPNSASYNRKRSQSGSRINFQELGIDNRCLRCGQQHLVKNCKINPKRLFCKGCKKYGHVILVCISTLLANKDKTNSTHHLINEYQPSTSETEPEDTFGINKIVDIYENQSYTDAQKFYVTVLIKNKPATFEVDSGAGFTLISESKFKELDLDLPLQKSDIAFRSYTKNVFYPLGKAKTSIQYQNKISTEEFYVVPDELDSLLGRVSCEDIQNDECNLSKYTGNTLNQNFTATMDVKIPENQFECEICSKHLATSLSLKVHMRIHTEEKPFKCEICTKQFSRNTHLTVHMIVHTGEKPFTCKICTKQFSTNTNLTRHIKVHTGKKPFACEICNKQFSESCNLKSHMVVHSGEKAFSCDICAKQYLQSSSLQSHMSVHTGEKPFTCKICTKQFSTNPHLTRHMRVHTGEKPFACEVCNKLFSESWHLKSHMVVHSGEKAFSCEICAKKYSQSSTLQSHMRVHTGEKPFTCQICNKQFSQRSGLEYHMKVHTGVSCEDMQNDAGNLLNGTGNTLNQNVAATTDVKTEENPFRCEFCSKQLTRSSCLKRHLRVHTGEKPFRCEICTKQFSTNSNLTIHMRVHTGEKPFECVSCEDMQNDALNLLNGTGNTLNQNVAATTDVKIEENPFRCEFCSKQLTRSSSLKRHMLVHSGERPFTCDLCNKQFSTNSHLTRHMRVHTGEKPFECKICTKQFSMKHALKSHMTVHTGEKPFRCEICSKQFSTNTLLTEHRRVHTGEKPFTCTICTKQFSNSSNLTHHLKTHTGERPFACEICNKEFSHSSYVKVHMRVHTGEKSACEICAKQYSDSAGLNRHMSVHTGEKSACEICAKQYSDSAGLKRHMSVHTGEKPFTCNVCSKQFSYSYSLQSHIRVHTGEKPFTCEICSKQYSHSSSLTAHVKTHTTD